LHKDSQDCQSIVTPDGSFRSTRVLLEKRNATQHLQSALFVTMEDIKRNIKVWMKDCLSHTKTEDDLLTTLNFFYKQSLKCTLKLQASKCVLFATMMRYRGGLITKDSVRFDPKNMDALHTMREQ
jgi:hypothetical protein